MEALVTRDDVAQVKPQPDLYLEAVQRLGLSPAECLALEDSDLGVQAAYVAQVNVIMVPDLLPPSAQSTAQAVCICASLHEVQTLLQGLNES
jgi:beta-phosphoglucomutase-like phosphatase (HAD superfamily)